MFERRRGVEGKSVFPPFLWPPITGHAVLQLSPECIQHPMCIN